MKLWNARSISGKLMRMTLLVSGTALLLAYVSFLGYDLYTLRRPVQVSDKQARCGVAEGVKIIAATLGSRST